MEPLTEKVTKYELDNALIQAFADAGGRSVKHQSMLRLAKNDWTLVDGKPVMRDAAGEISNVSLEDYFSKDFKTREPEYYEGTKAAGGGAAGVQKDGKRPETPATQPSKWTSDERRAFIEKNGQQAYRDLLNEQLREAVKPKEKAPA